MVLSLGYGLHYENPWVSHCGLVVNANLNDVRFGPHAEPLRVIVEPTKLVIEASSDLMRPTLKLLVEARKCELTEAPNLSEQLDTGLRLVIEGSQELLESTLGLLKAARKCEIK
jgi:hypothetical protein